MKSRNLSIIFFVLCTVFTAAFAIFLIRDYTLYYPYGSAPFYLYIIERAVEFLCPAVVWFCIGMIIRRKNKTSKVNGSGI